MKVMAIIQARMGSTRLPGKVLRDIGGETMLARVVHRAQRASSLDEVAVATTTEATDAVIVAECMRLGIPVFRGDEQDVLDRYFQAAQAQQAQVVVRITSDCPLIEPEVVDLVVGEFLNRQPKVDYVANTLPPRTFPRGLDTEVMRFDALERAWREDKNPAWREHVTPYIYRHPDRFGLYGVVSDKDYASMRWTVDTPEDLAFVRRVYEHFGHGRFSWREVLAVLAEHPEWIEINRRVRTTHIYDEHTAEEIFGRIKEEYVPVIADNIGRLREQITPPDGKEVG